MPSAIVPAQTLSPSIPQQRHGNETPSPCPTWCLGDHDQTPDLDGSRGHNTTVRQLTLGRHPEVRTVDIDLCGTEPVPGKFEIPLIYFGDTMMTARQAITAASALAEVAADVLSQTAPEGAAEYDSQDAESESDPDVDLEKLIAGRQHLTNKHQAASSLITNGSLHALFTELAEIAAQIRGFDHGIQSARPSEPGDARFALSVHLGHLMETAYTAIQQAYQDIIAASIVTGYQYQVADIIAASPTTKQIAADAHATEMAQLLGAIERHAGDANIGLRLPAHETWRKTETGCRPWCRNEATIGCDGYCTSDGYVALASADGGVMSDDGIAYPVVDVYATVCYPSNAESIGMNLMLPGRAANAFLHMTTAEARRVASALVAEAEQIENFHHLS